MKKIVLGIIVIISLLLITGCTKKEKVKKEINLNGNKYTCRDKDYSTNSFTTSTRYSVIMNNKKLNILLVENDFKYAEDSKYKKACKNINKEAEDANSNTDYVQYEIKCDDENNKIYVKKYYIINEASKNENIKTMLSYTFDYINKDGTFNLSGWKEEMKKRGSTC